MWTPPGAAPVVRARSQVVYQDRNWVPSFIYGTTPEHLEVREWTNLSEGEMFTESDVRSSTRVCIVGATIARELFRGQSPVGKEVRIQNVGIKVIGVLTSKGANTSGWIRTTSSWPPDNHQISGDGRIGTDRQQLDIRVHILHKLQRHHGYISRLAQRVSIHSIGLTHGCLNAGAIRKC